MKHRGRWTAGIVLGTILLYEIIAWSGLNAFLDRGYKDFTSRWLWRVLTVGLPMVILAFGSHCLYRNKKMETQQETHDFILSVFLIISGGVLFVTHLMFNMGFVTNDTIGMYSNINASIAFIPLTIGALFVYKATKDSSSYNKYLYAVGIASIFSTTFFLSRWLMDITPIWEVRSAIATSDIRHISRFSQHFISVVLGLALGALSSHKLRKTRWWVLISLIIISTVYFIITSALISNIFLFGFCFWVGFRLLREEYTPTKKGKENVDTLGSAKWADLSHLVSNDLVGEEGFFLGSYMKGDILYPLQYKGDRHLLTVAPTRSGKGVSAIVPNLLMYEGSCIIIDPKGENAKITAPRRGEGDKEKSIPGMGQAVRIVDPWGITGLPVSKFNPLDWLNPGDEDISENAMILADSIVTPNAGYRDQFWDEEAKALLMGLLLYVALDEREQGSRTLGRVRDIISLGQTEFINIMVQMQENENPIVSSTAERTISKEEKLRSNVLASLQAHTHFLDSPRIRASLAASDFRFEDLKTSKMTVYLVLPADRLETFGRWLRLLIQQAITVNARNIEAKPEKPILFLLDEMAALGRLAMVEQAFGLMAGFGMQLWGIAQDLSQLENIYSKGWETFIGNSGVLQYFGSRDQKTAEYFSKLCGVTTIKKWSFTESVSRAFRNTWAATHGPGGGASTRAGGHQVSYSDSTTEDVVQRNLVYPDELMVLKDGKQLLFVENNNPILSRRVVWHQDEKLKKLAINLHIGNNGAPPLTENPEQGVLDARRRIRAI